MPSINTTVPGSGSFTFQCPQCDETTVAFYPSWPFRYRCWSCKTLWHIRKIDGQQFEWRSITTEAPHADPAPS